MPQYSLDIGIEAVPSKCKTGAKIINFTALRNATNNVFVPFAYSLNRNKFKKHGVKNKARSWSQHQEASLRAVISALKQELIVLKQEKAELESLLKTQEEAKKYQIEEMQFEIDLNKLVDQVAEITQTKSFQQLQAEVEYLQNTDY